MKRNISRNGRLARGALGVICLLVAGYLAATSSGWMAAVFLVLGVFALFEALRGWCALRACGINTPL